jgi:peptide deformylase
MIKILTNPNPILRKKAEKIKDITTKEMQKLIPEMIETMLTKDGVGLAAPQIGQSVRLITVRYKDGTLVMGNPKIIKKSLVKEWDEEGCLSVPNVYGEVKRCKKITVKYLDDQGKEKQLSGEGLLARVIQHETDHLDGILFIDKARNLRKIENE